MRSQFTGYVQADNVQTCTVCTEWHKRMRYNLKKHAIIQQGMSKCNAVRIYAGSNMA